MMAFMPPPVPIGVGAAYRGRFGVHLELFARGRVVIVPTGIGVARGCTYPARTREPTGVIEVLRGAHLTLGDLFRLWQKPLDRTQLLGFRGRVLAFVGGKRYTRDPRSIPLERHAEIVLEIGGYVPSHTRYLFPAGL